MPENTCAGGNVHRNYSFSGRGILSFPKFLGIFSNPKELWSFETGSDIGGSPIMIEQTVFMGCENGKLYAIDALSGKEKWVFQSGDKIYSTPAYDGGMVFFASEDDYFYALDTASGEVVWKRELNISTICSPLVMSGIVYFGAGQTFYALDSQSGREKWVFKYEFWKEVYKSLELSPTMGDAVIFVGGDGFLFALNISDGSKKWRYPESEDVFCRTQMGTPAFSDGVLCFVTNENTYVALDANNGSEIWKKEFDTVTRRLYDPAIAGGLVFCNDIQDYHHSVFALDLRSGQEVWKTDIASLFWNDRNYVEAPPCIAEGIAHFVTRVGLLGLDVKTGKRKWIVRYESGHHAAAIADGILCYYSWKHPRCLKTFKDRRRQ